MRIHIPIRQKYLFFREDARAILQTARKQKKTHENIYLDFSEIHFMSRSFADELLNVVQELRDTSVTVKFQNLNPSLQQMLRRVQQTKAGIQKAMAHASYS